jgi:hypothetical protein
VSTEKTSIEETMKTLDEQLAAYAPKRHAKIKGTAKLDRLAKLVELPSTSSGREQIALFGKISSANAYGQQ